ncbi:MAG: transposase [Prevotella sp.]|jgi:hypothetical protein|nr:transposase [Prevotella sp.]
MKEAEKQGFEVKMDAAFVQSVFEENKRLHEEVARLNANLAWFMRQMFGRKSEKLSRLDPNQLGLDFEGFGLKLLEQGQTGEAVQATIEELPVAATKKKAARPHKNVLEGLPVLEGCHRAGKP